MVIIKDNKLLVFGALDDLRGAFVQLGLDLVDDRHDNGSEEAEDKDIDLALDVLDEGRQDGNLLNSLSYLLHKVIVPLDNGVDLLGHLLHLARKRFWLARGDVHL